VASGKCIVVITIKATANRLWPWKKKDPAPACDLPGKQQQVARAFNLITWLLFLRCQGGMRQDGAGLQGAGFHEAVGMVVGSWGRATEMESQRSSSSSLSISGT